MKLSFCEILLAFCLLLRSAALQKKEADKYKPGATRAPSAAAMAAAAAAAAPTFHEMFCPQVPTDGALETTTEGIFVGVVGEGAGGYF